MPTKLLLALGGTLLFLNLVVFAFEVIGRTLSPAAHIHVSAATVFLFVGALLLLVRYHPPAVLLAAGISVLFLLTWYIPGAASPVGTPAPGPLDFLWTILSPGPACFWIPMTALLTVLLRWLDRTSSVPEPRAATALLVAMPVVMVVTWVGSHVAEAAATVRFEEKRATQLAVHQARLRELRAAVAAGDTSKSCELVGSDPEATPEHVATCRRFVDGIGDPARRWKELAHLCVAGGDYHFKIWTEADRRDGGSNDVGAPVVPPSDQAWFIATYTDTWTQLGDAELLVTSGYVRANFERIDREKRYLWSEEGKAALDGTRRAAMVERLRPVLGSPLAARDPYNRAQAEGLLVYLEARR